jgi:hypothetical protein
VEDISAQWMEVKNSGLPYSTKIKAKFEITQDYNESILYAEKFLCFKWS